MQLLPPSTGKLWRVPLLKCYGAVYIGVRYISTLTPEFTLTGDFLSLHNRSTRNAGFVYAGGTAETPDHHARAACTQAGGAFHTNPDQYRTV